MATLTVGQALNVGAPLASQLGYYVMKLLPSEFIVTYQGTTTQSFLSGYFQNASSAKLENTGLFIYSGANLIYSIPITGITANVLEVQDYGGDVVAFDKAGDPYVLFTYNPEVVVDAVKFAAFEEAFENVQAEFRVLKQTIRPAPSLWDELDRKKAPKVSGFPGPNSEAGENVAAGGGGKPRVA
jgi:hypothetical protein